MNIGNKDNAFIIKGIRDIFAGEFNGMNVKKIGFDETIQNEDT
jgi:hypothetical protein